MVLGLGSALAGIAYIALGRVQEAIGLTHGILIGFSMVVPAALIALVVLLRGGGDGAIAKGWCSHRVRTDSGRLNHYAMERPANVESRRPDSNRGPLHYE